MVHLLPRCPMMTTVPPRTRDARYARCIRWALWISLAGGLPWAARAESLQCQAGGVGVGDTMATVTLRCGQPTATGTYCAPVEIQWLGPRPHLPYSRWLAPCQPVDEWIYDRGVGYLPAKLQFRGGRLWWLGYGQSTP